eukprot:635037-Pyramimonas_sp.AAC.1
MCIRDSGCTWWCHGRWWAQNVLLHPVYYAAIFAFKNIVDPKLKWSVFMEHSIAAHATALGLTYRRFSPTQGAQLEVNPTDDQGVLKAVEEHVDDYYWRFWSGSFGALHVLRVIARIHCL